MGVGIQCCVEENQEVFYLSTTSIQKNEVIVVNAFHNPEKFSQ